MSSKNGLTIDEVLENLNTIVEADSLSEIEITESGKWLTHEEAKERAVLGVPAAANEETIKLIRQTFQAIHKHVQTFYRKMKETPDKKRFAEGISAVMVLVGEAASKLEKFDTVFKEKIPQLVEYKDLQNFYRNKIIKESFKEFSKTTGRVKKAAGKTVSKHKIEEEAWEKEFDELLKKESTVVDAHGAHLLNEIETIKNDHLYELFYMKNEQGHPFYTEELARRLKLACDFGEFSKHYFGDDPLLQIKNWQDKSLHILAKRIVKRTEVGIKKFFAEAKKYKEVEIVSLLHRALFALMLAASPRNLIRQFAMKGCYLYFQDFQVFLRDVLVCRDYQKFLVYSPPSSTPFFTDTFTLIHELSFYLMTEGPGIYEEQIGLKEIVQSKSEAKLLTPFLQHSDTTLRNILKQHPSGPVFKALDILREESPKGFDPLLIGNLPSPDCVLHMGEGEVQLLRIASPTFQEFASRAMIVEEFKAFLHAASVRRGFGLLMINFQDRTSWKEHARSYALEELSKQAEFAGAFTVVTMAKETEFYHQTGHYLESNDASDFITHFCEHLEDENTGYYFPSHIRKELFPTFVSNLFKMIHKVFFEQKSTLQVDERLNFIELAYHFIELKVIEMVAPHFLSLTSKDGLDVASSATVGLIALIELINKKSWKDEELNRINQILYGPTLIQRERAIQKERFDRLHGLVALLQTHTDYQKSMASLFNKTTLETKIVFPKILQEE